MKAVVHIESVSNGFILTGANGKIVAMTEKDVSDRISEQLVMKFVSPMHPGKQLDVEFEIVEVI